MPSDLDGLEPFCKRLALILANPGQQSHQRKLQMQTGKLLNISGGFQGLLWLPVHFQENNLNVNRHSWSAGRKHPLEGKCLVKSSLSKLISEMKNVL